MGKSKKQIIASAEEAQAHAEAEKLLAQGDAAFGNPNQKIDVAADLAEIASVAGMDVNAAKEAAGFNTPETPQAPVEQQTEDTTGGFSEDPEKRLDEIAAALKQADPESPSAEQLKAWKGVCGDIYITDIENSIFIYRHLKRQEWIQMQVNPDLENMREDQIEDFIYGKCVLWPQKNPIEIAGTHAGAVPAIVQQIRMKSMFLDPAYVASVTLKI